MKFINITVQGYRTELNTTAILNGFGLEFTSVGDMNDYFCWRCDTMSPTYTGGNRAYSLNSGSTWSADTAQDFMFEIWS